MTENNTVEGVHLFRKSKEWLYKRHAKKYYWRIPKALQSKTIQEGAVIQGNKKQNVLVTKVFHEEGQEYDYRIIIESLGLYYRFSLSFRDYGQPRSIVTDKYALLESSQRAERRRDTGKISESLEV